MIFDKKCAIISCGKNNDDHHPHKVTLDKLERIGAKIFRTAFPSFSHCENMNRIEENRAAEQKQE